MALTSGRARLRALVALVLALGLLLAAVEPGAAEVRRPAVAADKAKKPPRGRKIEDWVNSAVGKLAYQERKRLGIERVEGRNLAIGFVDITGLNDVQVYEGQVVVEVDELKKSNPALYEELGLSHRPQIKKFVIIVAANDQSSNDKKSGLVTGAHSEIVILTRKLSYMWIDDKTRVFVMYTDRSPCEEEPNNCAAAIPPNTDVLFAVPYNKFAASRLKKFLDEAARLNADANRSTEDIKRGQEATARARQKALEKMAKNKEQGMGLFKGPKKTEKKAGKKPGQTPGVCQNQAFAAGPVPVAGAFARRPALLAAPCGDTEEKAQAGGLAQALTEPVPGAPGGIDFSSLQLKYLSDPGDGSGLRYSFQAPSAGGGKENPRAGETAATQTSNSFFVWLALNPSAFWVNLNPNEPDRIVDSRLGRTDAGRILLEADLQMKRTVGKLIHPDTETGRKFWDGVSGACTSQRVWILPSPATVRQDGDKLYIIDAPLDVRMEASYLAQNGRSSATTCAQQDKAASQHNEELFRGLILPKLKEAVNTAPEYADVRRVYLARVAAEWYRDLSRTRHTTYGDLIDKGDIDSWRTRSDWKPTDTFRKFVDSYTKGEFNVTRNTTSGDTIYARTYVYGGVDLTKVPFEKVSGDRFRKEHADLSRRVDTSLTSPSTADGDKSVWLGAPTPLEASGVAPDDGLSTTGIALRLLPALLIPVTALLWWRRRRLSTSATASPLRRAAVPHRQNRHETRRPS
ncbi:hypothetical protein [Streptomyces ehimensis]|uniref:Uncharacterized protein n=1 Tax=Streptomyces ehimensis TaxID=68195 RepID=A0ABV9BU62_9ACTN